MKDKFKKNEKGVLLRGYVRNVFLKKSLFRDVCTSLLLNTKNTNNAKSLRHAVV